MPRIESCWCGSSSFRPFGRGYVNCRGCGTLVREEAPEVDPTRVTDEAHDLYGRVYWFDHQAELGLPDLVARSRSDLGERCLHWLRHVLRHRLPPGRSLELGAAHGGFVALLTAVGFDAVGVELSPWVVDFARRAFDVKMLQGPVEQLQLEAGSFELICAMDVVEHLPDPLATLRRSSELLSTGGCLFLQTPCHRAGHSLADPAQAEDGFFRMLLPEHLHLFTRESIAELCRRAGLPEVAFLPACFSDYDMFLVASRRPITPHDEAAVRSHLETRPGGRLAAALLDLDRRLAARTDAFLQADRDRTERQSQIDELQAVLEEAHRREAQTGGAMQQVREQIDRLEREGASLRRADQGSRQALEEERASREHLQTETCRLQSSLQQLGRQQEAMSQELERQRRALLQQGRRQAALEQVLGAAPVLSAQLPKLPHLPTPELTWTFTAHPPLDGGAGAIGIDLTALRPGGENGGAGLVATTLVRQLVRLAPDTRFLLLTSTASHHLLSGLEAGNASRRLVSLLPEGLSELLIEEPVRLILCPMTAPPSFDPRVPSVCLIHDLQHRAYPGFFTDLERGVRERAFTRAVAHSELLITVSEHVRRTVLEQGVEEERVLAIPNGAADRLPAVGEREVEVVLARWGLEPDRFFLYPANFWPHKNHRMLLIAFGQLLDRRPGCGLHLVLTGSARPDPQPLRQAALRMGLGERVLFTGYLPDSQLSALLRGCRALVFPSLYEGFGMPLVEAMACGKPVLCSGLTSLPEVAGEAALLFDPRRPAAIVDAMQRVLDDVELAKRLGERGPKRAAELGDGETMARAYLQAIDRVASAPRRFRDRLGGVYGDGWTLRRFAISHAEPEAELELGLRNPRHEVVTVSVPGSSPQRQVALEPHHSILLRCRLPAEPGLLELTAEPTFCPAQLGGSEDRRQLGIELTSCRLYGSAGETDLIARIPDG